MERLNSIDTIVMCHYCQNEIPITRPRIQEVKEIEEPPPNYSSLRYIFLADEPPKYQDVTGRDLPVRVRNIICYSLLYDLLEMAFTKNILRVIEKEVRIMYDFIPRKSSRKSMNIP